MRLINRIIPGEYRYPTITPFTIPDGHTYLKTLERLVECMRKLIDSVNENNEEMQTFVVELINNKIEEINTAFTEFEGEIDDKITSVDTKISELETFVNDAVDSVINNSIELQDAVLSNIIDDENSDSRQSFNNIYATHDQLNQKRESDSYNVKLFGAIGDGVADDTTAIQEAINAARDEMLANYAVGTNLIVIPTGRYRITQQIIQPPYVKIVTSGAVVIESEVENDSAWWITPLETDPASLYPGVFIKQNWLAGELIDGSNGGFVLMCNNSDRANTVGLELGSRTNLTSDRPLSRYGLKSVWSHMYYTGIRWNAFNHYMAHYDDVRVENCHNAVHVVGTGANSGENITWNNCLFAASQLDENPETGNAFLIEAPNIDMNFNNCSADFMRRVFYFKRGWQTVTWNNGHIEVINTASRHVSNGGIGVEDITVSDQAPRLNINGTPFVSSQRGTQFRGNIILKLDMEYRVNASDFSVNQQPENNVLCDSEVTVYDVKWSQVGGGMSPARQISIVRGSDFANEVEGTVDTDLEHFTATGSTGDFTINADAPYPGAKSIRAVFPSTGYRRWLTKYVSPIRRGEHVWLTFARKASLNFWNATAVAVWLDADMNTIDTTQTVVTTGVTALGEWRMPNGMMRLVPPAGTAFVRVGFQISATPANPDNVMYVGDFQAYII